MLPVLHYPAVPGAKGDLETGHAAAAALAPSARTLHGLCVRALDIHGHQTADEIADRLGRSILSVRPRLSELRATGHVVDTAVRRRNASGKRAVVWALTSRAYTQPELLPAPAALL